MSAAPPKPMPSAPSLSAALRATFSPRKELGAVTAVTARDGHLVCVFENGVELELQGDPAAWLEQLSAALVAAEPPPQEDD